MHNTVVKKIILFIVFALMLASCSGWGIQPLPYNPPTPFLPPSRTPSIYSPTPVIIGTTNASSTPVVLTNTTIPSSTPTEIPVSTYTPTSPPNSPGLHIIILGCNTSIDIMHGMGEVTNAYIILKNVGTVDLTNLVATLYALDEGREHPDKIREIPSIPIHYEITLKMTADSTYSQESPIQVEVSSGQGLFPREGVDSCRDIGVFAPKPEGLDALVPSNP